MQIISKWNKEGVKWVNRNGTWVKEKTGLQNMAMVITEVNGKKVTRHINL